MDEIPELGDLIASVPGNVYEWMNAYWITAENVREAVIHDGRNYGDKGVGKKGDLIRVGFKLYEILGYASSENAYYIRQFRANLSEGDLMRLSGQDVL